ncbi:hypothetical protein D3C76_1227530 [compost metagenome]
MWPVLFLECLFCLALDPFVEDRGVGIGINRADHDQVPRTQFAGAFAVGHYQVKVHFAKRLFGTGLLDGAAQAAVGDIHPPF